MTSSEASDKQNMTSQGDGVHNQLDQISLLAYNLWCQRGCPDGSPDDDWYNAERQLSEADGQNADGG